MAIIILKDNSPGGDGCHFEFDSESDVLGEGGMGRVYRGRRVDKAGNWTYVAIKSIFSGLPDQVIERARREASIQIHNDSLVRMYGFVQTLEADEFGVESTHYYVISEWLDGISLDDMVMGKLNGKGGKPHPNITKFYQEFVADRKTKSTEIIKSVLAGVMALHDAGYIHRDIDPSNIMVTTDGRIKLIDFGVAKQVVRLSTADKSLTSAGQFIGKAGYASPELILGDVRHQNYSTDVYAIGILYYFLLKGHLPFEGNTYDIINSQLKKKIQLGNIGSRQIARVIRKATEKNQNDRYVSSAQMRADIDNFRFPERWYRDPRLTSALGSLTLIAIGAALFFIVPKPATPEAPSTEKIYEMALRDLSSEDSVTVASGLSRMDSLATRGYEPAMYQVALTYGWVPGDSVSVSRKAILGLTTDPFGLLVDNSKNEEAVERFRRYVKVSDAPDPNAFYILGCYYANGVVVNYDENTAREYFEHGREIAVDDNDSSMIDKFDDGLRNLDKIVQARKMKESLKANK